MRASFRTLGITLLSIAAAGSSAFLTPRPILIWNVSASVLIGLYVVTPVSTFHVDDLVVVEPPDALATVLDRGGYLPKGIPLVKHIGALAGQTICRMKNVIIRDGIVMGEAQARDGRGRLLPTWQGCHKISEREIFLMNIDTPDSLDGRYFGALPASTVIGRAIPLRTRAGR